MAAPEERALHLGLLLAAVALAGTGLMVLAAWHAGPYIAASERRELLQSLEEVLVTGSYDNLPAEDRITVVAPERLGPDGPATVYRARRDGEPVAAVFTVVAPDGYTGPIRLLVGVDVAGAVTGVRVVAHKETPGLGDAIEAERSDWIRGFHGRSRRNVPDRQWKVRRDGGRFDQLTGATITPRAVVAAVHRCLQYFDAHRDSVFASPPGELAASGAPSPSESR
jgi:electron transport complex protein RnfG